MYRDADRKNKMTLLTMEKDEDVVQNDNLYSR